MYCIMKYNAEVGLFTKPSNSKADIKNSVTNRAYKKPFYLVAFPLKHGMKAITILAGGAFLESFFKFNFNDIVFHNLISR